MIALPSTAEPAVRRPFYRHLYFQVLTAIVAGAIIGHFWPSFGESLKPLGDAFIKLVKMIIAPVIFLTIVTGIAQRLHGLAIGGLEIAQQHADDDGGNHLEIQLAVERQLQGVHCFSGDGMHARCSGSPKKRTRGCNCRGCTAAPRPRR